MILTIQYVSIQSVIFYEKDECTGLYIVEHGTLGGNILNLNRLEIPLEKKKESSLVGEVAFFLKSKRTATILTKQNARLFFLDIKFKKTFLSLCPKIHKRMRDQIYQYDDEILENKIHLLRESVYYFKSVERRALVELAF